MALIISDVVDADAAVCEKPEPAENVEVRLFGS